MRRCLWMPRPANLVVQPANRGTTPAILYALLRIAAVDPTALVAFFPSDHYVSDDEGFMEHIAAGFEAVRVTKGSIILLGIHAETPEVEYGWIRTGGSFLFQRMAAPVPRPAILGETGFLCRQNP